MSSEKQFNVEIEGVRPLILSSDLSTNKRDPRVIEKSKIQKSKNKDNDEEFERVQWLGYALSFYSEKDAPWIPSENILRSMQESAHGVKKNSGKAVLADVDILDDEVEIIYKGPKNTRELYDLTVDDERPFVFMKQVRIPPRTGPRVPHSRPRFKEWAMKFTLVLRGFTDLSASNVKDILTAAGQQRGLCSWRGRYGLFQVNKFQEFKAAKAA